MTLDWLQIDWGADRPDHKQMRQASDQLTFSPVLVDLPALEPVLSSFAASGYRTAWGAFEVGAVGPVAHWFFSRNRFSELDFLGRLLTSSAVAAALPDVVGGSRSG